MREGEQVKIIPARNFVKVLTSEFEYDQNSEGQMPSVEWAGPVKTQILARRSVSPPFRRNGPFCQLEPFRLKDDALL